MSTQASLDWTVEDEALNRARRAAERGKKLRAEREAPFGARVSVEAGITPPWCLFTGEAGASIGIDHFGASADFTTLYRESGITAERVAAAARDSLARA